MQHQERKEALTAESCTQLHDWAAFLLEKGCFYVLDMWRWTGGMHPEIVQQKTMAFAPCLRLDAGDRSSTHEVFYGGSHENIWSCLDLDCCFGAFRSLPQL